MNLLPTNVSDHCVLRYLERVRGMDVEAVRKEIVGMVRPAAAVGAKRVTVNGFTYVIDKQVVITVVKRGWR